MILVADSGSTKTDWLLKQPGQEARAFRTPGLNPYFLTEKEIVKVLQEQAADIVAYAADIKEIYRTVWEIKQRHLIDMAADRGAFHRR